jgi:hypothetical protein
MLESQDFSHSSAAACISHWAGMCTGCTTLRPSPLGFTISFSSTTTNDGETRQERYGGWPDR